MEKKYYLVQVSLGEIFFGEEPESDPWTMSDEEFKETAENEGRVYTQEQFVKAFNNETLSNVTQILRIL